MSITRVYQNVILCRATLARASHFTIFTIASHLISREAYVNKSPTSPLVAHQKISCLRPYFDISFRWPFIREISRPFEARKHDS